MGSAALEGFSRELGCLEGLRSGGRGVVGEVGRLKGLSSNLGGGVRGTGALIRLRSLCHPCGDGGRAETAGTHRGNLRPLTMMVVGRSAARGVGGLTGGCVASRIGARRRTVRNTRSVVTRRVSSGSRFEGGVERGAFCAKRVRAGTGGGSRSARCSLCCGCSRGVGGVPPREVLTVGETRGRNMVGKGVAYSDSRVARCLGERVLGGISGVPRGVRCGPGAAPVVGRTVVSTCGELVSPTVRERVEGCLARGTRRGSVRIFTGGLGRLLVRDPLIKGAVLK